ncbi:MAG: porin family protein [Bacteroidota bacterium]
MKKIIILTIVLFAFNLSNAQETTQTKFGLKGGLNLANFTGDSDGSNSRVGIQAGFYTEFKISDKFAIQPELLYSIQGASDKGTTIVEGYTVNYKAKFNLGYINLPIMAKYYTNDKFNIEFGPQIGFLANAKLKTDVTIIETGQEGSSTDDAKEFFKGIDFGLNFGLGYNFSDKIGANLRYNAGLTNIADTDDGSKIHNSVFSLSLNMKL